MKALTRRVAYMALLALTACASSQRDMAPAPAASAEPRPIQETVPATTSTIPAQTYYFNPARAGSAGY